MSSNLQFTYDVVSDPAFSRERGANPRGGGRQPIILQNVAKTA